MFEYVRSFEFNSLLGMLLYWLPLSICVVGYTARTWSNYQADVKSRNDPAEKYYIPTDTVGSLIGRVCLSVIPVGNLIAAIFDAAPPMFGRFFEWVGRTFDQPLVPKRKP